MKNDNDLIPFVYTPYKDIPELPTSILNYVSQKFGIAEVSDFDPSGDKDGKNIPWKTISQAVLVRDNYECRICGSNTMSPVSPSADPSRLHFTLEVHHIIPRKDGGKDTFKNLITLCERCHHRTFSNEYAGIPGEDMMNLDAFYTDFWTVIPSELDGEGKTREKGTIEDYGVVFDAEENIRTVRPVIGQRIEVLIEKLSIDDFMRLASKAVYLLSATDYSSFSVHLVSGKMVKARCLRSRDRILV